jgi:hypothetical protein
VSIKYQIHRKTENDKFSAPLTHTLGDSRCDDSIEVDYFDNRQAASAWLLEKLRLKRVDGEYEEYVIQAYDEEGNLVEEVSPEDRDAAANDARVLVGENPDVTMAFNTMIAARQMYVFAYTELERSMSGVVKVGDRHGSPHPLTLEVLTQAATKNASKPFEAANLFDKLGQNIFPWMNHAIRKNVIADEVDKKADIEALEVKRRAVRIPVGVKVDPEDDGLLDRSRPLVLVGYDPAVRLLLDTITNNVLATRDSDHPDKLFTVVRFDWGDATHENQDYLLRIPYRSWVNCTRSQDNLGEFVLKHVANHLNKVPDLLVVDDLASAFTIGSIVTPTFNAVTGSGYAPYRMADAQKRLSVWYKHAGMGMVAGCLLNHENPVDCASGELEKLRMFCTVRPVSVIRKANNLAEGQVRLLVGKNAWHIDVDEKLIGPPL